MLLMQCIPQVDGVIDLSGAKTTQGGGSQEPHRKKQFRKLLGDGEDSAAAALR